MKINILIFFSIEVGQPNNLSLNEFTEGAVTQEMKTTSQAWPHWWNKKEAGVRIQSSWKHFITDYEVSTEATPV